MPSSEGSCSQRLSPDNEGTIIPHNVGNRLHDNSVISQELQYSRSLHVVSLHDWFQVKVEVKWTPVQALRLCTGRTAYRGSRGIALPFHDHGTRKGVRGQRHAPAALYPRERPSTHCTEGWVGPRAVLNRCRKSRPPLDSIPGPSSP
jgi:hypothetical protein